MRVALEFVCAGVAAVEALKARSIMLCSICALALVGAPPTATAKLPELPANVRAKVRVPLVRVAQSVLTKSINVPAGNLADAIVVLSQQTGEQISVNTGIAQSIQTQGVSGDMTAAEALKKLLQGTPLQSTQVTNAGFLVEPPAVRTAQGVVLQGITVTGERVERSVYDTPSSVTVVTGEQLEETPAVQNIEDALEDIPNIVTFGGSNNGPAIRGQLTNGPLGGAGAGVAGTLPRATITLDGRALSFNEFIYGTTSVWDVETVEVYRGPQTTSQGTNSIAGAIYIQTKDPTYHFESAGRAQFSSFDGKQGSAMVSGPIIADQLAVRAAIDYRERDTYIDYATPNQNLIDENLFIDQLTARAKILWEPKALPGFSAKLTYSHTETSSPQTEIVNEPFSQLARTTNPSPSAFTTNANSLIQDTSYALTDTITVTNQFQWNEYESNRLVANPATGAGNTEGTDLVNETLIKLKNVGGRVSGVFGSYVRNVEQDERGQLGTEISTISDEKDSLGLFSELTYKVTEKLDLTGGIRYQRDKQIREGVLNIPGSSIVVDFDGEFDEWLPKFAIGYDLADNIRIGGIASKGFNPGGLNTRTIDALLGLGTDPLGEFKEETLWNYELFMRGRFLDSRLAIDANIFYTDHTDLQLVQSETITIPFFGDQTQNFVINADEATTYGMEIAADFQVSDTLRLYGSAGLLQTEIEKASDATLDIIGKEFALAPNFTGTAGFDWEFVDKLTFGTKVRYNNGYFSDDENTKAFEVDPYTVVDLKLNYQPDERLKIYGFANNVLDDIYPVNLFNPGTGTVGTTGVPQEFGVGALIKFE